MKTTLKVALVFIGVSALAGCKPEHDKDWYKSHETERKQMLVECKRTLNPCRMLIVKMQETQRLNFLFMGKITLIACRS